MSFDSQRAQFEKEHIYIVEIDVPRCVNVHGTSPCTATETGDDKCYNTRSTCNDLPNYNELIDTGAITINVNATNKTFTRTSGSFITDGFEVDQIITTTGNASDGNNSQFKIESVTATVITVTSNFGLVTESGSGDEQVTTPNLFTYQFCSARSPHPQNLNNCAPCVNGVSIAPATIDARGGIGARASASVGMDDFPSSDRYDIDPYLSDRTYDPFEVGLHFTKWRARNANYENNSARILSGYIVDETFDRGNFDTRHYVIASMTATGGKASFSLKDPLQLVSNKQALAPAPSNGSLNSAITNSATSLTLTPSGVGNDEYPASAFYVKISSEVLLCSSRSGDVLTVSRGELNTTAAAHSSNDTVQLCLEYTGQPVDEVQADLLINYAKVPAYYIPKGAWQATIDTYTNSNPDRVITDPTRVQTLVSELCEQWPHKLFWDDREQQITLDAIWEPPASANSLDQNNDLMELSVQDKPDMQISSMFVFYGQIDPTKKIDEKDNYQITYVRANTDAIARYNSNNTKTIFAPWISTANGATARRVAQLYGRRFGITPRQVKFLLEDKDADVWLGENRFINHRDICDRNGNPVDTLFEITSASESKAYEYVALEYDYDEELSIDDNLQIDVIDLPVNERELNLRTRYDSVFGTPTASTEVKFIVYSGVVIGSNTVSVGAIDTGSWPAGAVVTLQIDSGFVVGKGGTTNPHVVGGPAIVLSYDLTIINNGTIGGGGGAGQNRSFAGSIAYGGTGAGDVGAGTGLGNPGQTIFDGMDTAFAGAGGQLGVAGSNGSGAGTAGSGPSNPGKAVDLNGFTLTQTVSGTIKGVIS